MNGSYNYIYTFLTVNLASDSLVLQDPKGSQPANLANDGNTTSCSKTQGHNITFQVDLKTESLVTGMYITAGGM